jgi:hypothetical protein
MPQTPPGQAAFDEIDVLYRIIGRFEDLARLEVHHFEGGLQQGAVGRREHRQGHPTSGGLACTLRAPQGGPARPAQNWTGPDRSLSRVWSSGFATHTTLFQCWVNRNCDIRPVPRWHPFSKRHSRTATAAHCRRPFIGDARKVGPLLKELGAEAMKEVCATKEACSTSIAEGCARFRLQHRAARMLHVEPDHAWPFLRQFLQVERTLFATSLQFASQC